MPAPDLPQGTFSREATRFAGSVTELLDVLWARAKESSAGTATSASQLRLMYIVERAEAIRMRTLCRRLGTTPPSVSRQCDRLQAMGFLERLPSPDSGREITLRLTGAGTTHLRHVREQRENVLRHAIDAMPPAEQRALAKGLAGLHDQLTGAAAEPGRPDTASAA